jgi:hypothetical protein
MRGDSTQQKSTYRGGLDETAVLSLYSQVWAVKHESHEPKLIDPPVLHKSPPFIIDPGLPDRSLRKFTRNLASRTTRRERADVIYLSDTNHSRDGVDAEFSIDENVKTIPARVHVNDNRTTTTVFVSLPSPSQVEEAFSGELFVSPTPDI